MSTTTRPVRAAPSAWQLEKAMSIAMATVDQLDQEGVDTDDAELFAVIHDQGADINTLMVRLLCAADEADAQIDMIAIRQVKLARRKERIQTRHATLRASIQSMIEALPSVFPDGKYQCAEFTVSLRPGGPRQIVTDESLLPVDCWRTKRQPNMSAINERAKAGPVPGVTESNAAPILTIKGR